MAIETPARIAVIGAGPIGLEAALYARYLGYDVDVYERGRVAENLLQWGHVRMFSPFGQNRSPLGLAALKAQDPAWQPPGDDELLSGRELAAR
jgi:2-polyprenyl-6-methoxyphenol hydroxylase-like FAD-dependent oxidoreductase